VSLFTTGLAELVLIVEDVPRAAKFYREVVGLEPENPADEAWAWFFAGDSVKAQRIALHKGSLLFEEHSPHPAGHRFGSVHLALEVPRERFAEAVDHVRRSGTEVYGPTRFDWMSATSYYFYDPDGNLLEFWSPDDS
jgi:catechol 2,3-dioxygenase-like lactoylglutathione lyase family enzyme